VPGMEKNVSVQVGDVFLSQCDKLCPEFGFTRLIHQCNLIFGYDGRLYTSRESGYDALTPLGYGTPSGWFHVSQNNQLALCSACCEYLEDKFGHPVSVSELNDGDRVLLLSKTDDNMMVLLSEEDYSLVAAHNVTVQNLPLEFEVEKDARRSVGEFLAYEYWLDRESLKIQVIKKLGSQVTNKLLSEYGMKEVDSKWYKVGKTGLRIPGLGYVLGALDYAYHDNFLVVDDLLRTGFRKFLKAEWYELWPVRVADLDPLVEATDPKSILRALMHENPDWAHRMTDIHDLPLDIVEEFFLFISVEEMKELAGDALQYEEWPAGHPAPPRDERRARQWMEAAIGDLRKAQLY